MSDDELTEAIETEPTPDEHDPEGFTALLRAEALRRFENEASTGWNDPPDPHRDLLA